MGLLMDPSVPFPQPRHWVIGDIHGCHSCMVALLDVLPKKDHLIFCGDVINGGPQIEACMTLAWDLMRCGQAYGLDGRVQAGSAVMNRVVLDGLGRLPEPWQGCGLPQGVVVGDAAVCWEHSSGAVQWQLQGQSGGLSLSRDGQALLQG